MPINKNVFIKNYLSALNNGDAAIFAGAGLSAPSGCVNWKQLLREIAEELELDIEKESDLVAIAQYYYNKNGCNRTKLNDTIKDAFQTGKQPNVNHNILAKLPIFTYWTTNYDKLIEKALENNGKICDIKTCCANLTTTLKGRNVVVYKMHGDVDHPEDAVLIRDDYESYNQEKAPFINTLSGDLMTKTFLFIGFSFTDPNFYYICAHLRARLKGNMREHYCFLKDVSKTDYKDEDEFKYEKRKLSYFIDDLKRFNIKTVLIQEYSEITEILQSIKRVYNGRTVYLSGAAAEYNPDGKDAYEKFISKLSGRLIYEGYKIVSGYGLGVGSAVISGALSEIYYNQKKSLTDQLILRPFPQGDDAKEMWETYRQDMISYSGISIFLLGNKKESGTIVPSNGMRSEYEISKEQGNFLIPIGRTGYISKELWNELLEERQDDHTFDIYRHDIESLGDDTKTLDEVIEIVIELIKKSKITMAHKTFISYKYSEAQDLRDRIIKALGDDASYYQGETSDSPDLTDTSTENIKKNLKDMMYDTSVTIVIISPHIKESKWIDWEIEYCLKNITRKNRTSHTNGVVGVIMKVNGGYDWFKYTSTKPDGCSVTNYYDSKVYDIINNNRYNQYPKVYSCNQCKCVNALTGSYIAFVEEDEFLSNPQKYINNAYDKSEKDAEGYNLTKQR